MINRELLKTSLQSMWKRKSRSSLTIISVFIGVTAIFVLISFGQGLIGFINETAAQMGEDKIIVQAKGFGFGPPPTDSNVIFKDRDVKFIEKIQGVKEATGLYFASAPLEFEDTIKYIYVIGSDIKNNKDLVTEVYNTKLYSGLDLDGDESKQGVFGYGYTVDDKTFPQPLVLRDRVLISNTTIKVKGFYEAVGNPIDDYNVYLTKDAFEDIFEPKSYNMILIRSSPGIDATKLSEIIKDELIDERGQSRGNEDFFVETFEQVIESFTSVLITLNVILVLIALISLVVAGVNIANTMYTSVLERTKEIGVMKAIGAKNSDILFMFAFESGLLSLIGGLIAVILGTIIAIQAGELMAKAGYGLLTPALSLELYAACLLFSVFIGVFSGLMPAYRASKMKPIDALRYE